MPASAPPIPQSPPSQRGRAWVAGAALLLTLLQGVAVAAPGAEQPGLAEARRLIGANPEAARPRLQALRADAMARKRLDWRLHVDELECRLLTDIDLQGAERVSAAGLAAAPAPLQGADEMLRQRLRACHGGVLMDLGQDDAGKAELQAVIAATADEELAAARAMALLERGLRRSRHGDLVTGQEDLLWACETLARKGTQADEELCLSHLANQHKRAGDLDEAQRILSRLLASARQRGAAFDEGIYVYGLAQVHAAAGRWEDARRGFAEALANETRRGDVEGMVYSEHGLADALLHLGHPQQALEHVRMAVGRMKPGEDPQHAARLATVRAAALLQLGQPAQAEQAMRPHAVAVRAKGDGPQLASWLQVQAQVQAALGRWRESYETLAELRALEGRLHAQQLSRESARLRQQFNRERDAQAIRTLEQANSQGQRLRELQGVALGLFVLLLVGTALYATRKFREARRLRSQALHDELTTLPNRRAILAQGEGLLRELQRTNRGRSSGDAGLSVLMIDADHFKHVNDRYGHVVGDQVLRELATRLGGGLRGKDTLGRLGGEEFVALLPDAGREQALAVAERMRRLVAAQPLPTSAGPVLLTVSLGAATLHAVRAGDSLQTLLERADSALYRAKAEGRNCVVWGDGSATDAAAATEPARAVRQPVGQD